MTRAKVSMAAKVYNPNAGVCGSGSGSTKQVDQGGWLAGLVKLMSSNELMRFSERLSTN